MIPSEVCWTRSCASETRKCLHELQSDGGELSCFGGDENLSLVRATQVELA